MLPDNGVAEAAHQGRIKTRPGENLATMHDAAGWETTPSCCKFAMLTIAPDQTTLPSNVWPMQGYRGPVRRFCSCRSPCAMLRQHTEDAIMNDLFDIMQTTRSMRRLKRIPCPTS